MAGKLGPQRIKNKNYGSQDILTAIIFKNTAAEPPSEAAAVAEVLVSGADCHNF